MTPFISVIMPVRNEAAHIEATLRPLLKQQYDPDRYEILVIDGKSTDGTVTIVRRLQAKYHQIHLFTNPNQLSSAGRNIGVGQARGDYIVIVDGHCEIRSLTYLRDLASAFDRRGVDCLGRPQPLDVTGANLTQRAIAIARASPLGHHPASHIYSANGGPVKAHSVAIAYRREVFDCIGLFDEQFDACEDVEFNHRVDQAGFKCRLIPELAVHYRPRTTLRGLFHQMERYGRGRIRLLQKHRDTWSWAVFAPAALILMLICSAVVGLAWHPAIWFFGVIAGSYSACMMIAGMTLAVTSRALRLVPLMPAVLVTIHLGAGWGVLTELFRVLLIKVSSRLGLSRIPQATR